MKKIIKRKRLTYSELEREREGDMHNDMRI
jgi:hypothetical protein